ncbi:MAG: hypothetical protein Q4G58_02280 [bacterium]|nr:hypothetical protein [bacterium]
MKQKSEQDKTTIATTSTNTSESAERDSMKDKINLDYDWNTEYGDGDIPNVDK